MAVQPEAAARAGTAAALENSQEKARAELEKALHVDLFSGRRHGVAFLPVELNEPSPEAETFKKKINPALGTVPRLESNRMSCCEGLAQRGFVTLINYIFLV